MNISRWVVAALCLLNAPSGATAQGSPPRNKELEALQAHFELVIGRRHEQLFNSITTVEQWERRKQQARGALTRMLWHDMRWPDGPPPATVTHREQHPAYTIENLVLETAPKVFLTANLYLPRSGTRPFPVVLYQCGHASKHLFARHGAWFAANGIAALVMDNIEMGEVEFTHHGVYSRAWFHWYSRGFSPLAVELLNARRAVDYLAARPDLDRHAHRRDGTIGRRHDDLLPGGPRRSDQGLGAGVGNALDQGMGQPAALDGALRLPVPRQQPRVALLGGRRADRAAGAAARQRRRRPRVPDGRVQRDGRQDGRGLPSL